MATLGKSQAELIDLANSSLRNQTGCATVTVTSLEYIPEQKVGSNWVIGNVLMGDVSIEDLDRGTKAVNEYLGRHYHLLDGDD